MVAKQGIAWLCRQTKSSSSKIIDGSKTLWHSFLDVRLSSSSKIIDGSKTKGVHAYYFLKSSSSKIIDGSKTHFGMIPLRNMSSSSKIIDGSKTSNWFYHIIEILTTFYNMTLSYWSSLRVPYSLNPLNIH